MSTDIVCGLLCMGLFSRFICRCRPLLRARAPCLDPEIGLAKDCDQCDGRAGPLRHRAAPSGRGG
jgi:hypothetical protein